MRTLKGLLAYFVLVEQLSNEQYKMYSLKPGYTMVFRYTEDGDEWRDPETDIDIIYVSNEDGRVVLDNDYELIDFADIDIFEVTDNSVSAKPIDF